MTKLKTLIVFLGILAAEPLVAQVIAENPPWKLTRVPDEKYGAGYGCQLTISQGKAEMRLTAYFLGADVEITAGEFNLEPHKGSLALYLPDLDSAMTITGANFEEHHIRARGGEQVLMQMLEAMAKAESEYVVVFDDETQLGVFKSPGLSKIMPEMRTCFESL